MRKIIFISLIGFLGLTLNAQEVSEPIPLKVSLDFIQNYTDSSFKVIATVYKVENNARVAVPDVLCNLHLTEVSKGGMMGSNITDKDGKVEFPLVGKFKKAKDTIPHYAFILKIANDERFVDINDTSIFYKSEFNAKLISDSTYYRLISNYTGKVSNRFTDDFEIEISTPAGENARRILKKAKAKMNLETSTSFKWTSKPGDTLFVSATNPNFGTHQLYFIADKEVEAKSPMFLKVVLVLVGLLALYFIFRNKR